MLLHTAIFSLYINIMFLHLPTYGNTNYKEIQESRNLFIPPITVKTIITIRNIQIKIYISLL